MRPEPGRETPGLVTLRESRVNAAKDVRLCCRRFHLRYYCKMHLRVFGVR